MLPKHLLLSASAFLALAVSSVFAESDTLQFNVQGTNPGGKGGYTGEVSIIKTKSPESAVIRWVTGSNKAVTEGIAIRTEGAIGAGYGGKSFYALAVYHLDGNKIHGTWALATTPADVGTYDLKGSDYDGKCKFADGPGSVTFTEGKNGAYKVSWDLPSGHFDGIGLRVKDTLVAASGDMDGGFGIVALQPKGDEIEGIWTTSGASGVGKEVWTLKDKKAPTTAGGAIGNGKSVEFAGDTYVLKDQKSIPGPPPTELREYLRDGEDWDGYRKMVAFRTFRAAGTASEFAEGILEETKKNFPGAYTKELEAGKDSATIFFIIVSGDNVEMDLWNYHRTKNGMASAQFVLRNKPPYDTQKKFKAEQDKNFDDWTEQIKKLGAQAEQYIEATAAGAGDAPDKTAKTEKTDKDISPELVKAIKGDLDQCGKLAQKFMALLQEGKTADAVALLGDSAFKKMSREDFTAALEKSSKTFGTLQNFKPDKSATDFGIKDGVMTFTLQADAQYEHARVRETLRFIRNDRGEIEFTGYNRTAKE